MIDAAENLNVEITPVDVTVVVGSYNRAEMLAQTIDSLIAIDTKLADGGNFTYEVVVIDNASTDNTQEVIARYTQSGGAGNAERVRGFLETEAGVTYARNRGINESAGRWIAFHDDDQKAHPRWLAQLLDLVNRRDLSIAGGAVHLVLPEDNNRILAPQCRQLLGEKVGMLEEQPYGRKRIPGTNNLLVRRSVLDEVGIFDTSIKDGGEDADLYRRIRIAGYEAWYTPDAIVYHLIPAPRLSNEYMRWTATRHGQHLALREYNDWGRSRLALMITARSGQALLNYLPKYLFALISFQKEKAIGARALLWRSQAYVAKAYQLVSQGNTNRHQDVSMNLREGREMLIHGKAPS